MKGRQKRPVIKKPATNHSPHALPSILSSCSIWKTCFLVRGPACAVPCFCDPLPCQPTQKLPLTCASSILTVFRSSPMLHASTRVAKEKGLCFGAREERTPPGVCACCARVAFASDARSVCGSTAAVFFSADPRVFIKQNAPACDILNCIFPSTNYGSQLNQKKGSGKQTRTLCCCCFRFTQQQRQQPLPFATGFCALPRPLLPTVRLI